MLHNPQHRQNAPLVQYPQVCGRPEGSAPDLYFDLEAKAGWKIIRSVWPAAALVLGCESREMSHPHTWKEPWCLPSCSVDQTGQ